MLGHRRGTRPRGGHRRHRTHNRCCNRLRTCGMASRLDRRQSRRAGRGRRRRSRHRMRHAGDGRELLVLRRSRRARVPRIPVRRDRRRRLLGDRQASRYGRQRQHRYGHKPTALRNRIPQLSGSGRHQSFRHDPTRGGGQGPRPYLRGTRREASRDAEGVDELLGRFSQRHGDCLDRYRHRRQSRPHRTSLLAQLPLPTWRLRQRHDQRGAYRQDRPRDQ